MNNFKNSEYYSMNVDVLGEHSQGICLFAYGNIVCSLFTYDRSEYSETIMHNFIN